MPLRHAAEGVTIRSAVADDAQTLLAIYAPLVVETAISFEIEPPTVEQFRERIEITMSRWAWFVAERESQPVGYAYAGAHRARAAYRWSVETSVIVASHSRGAGIGTTLYRELLQRLADLGYCNAYAAIALPNAASIALHRRTGFEPVGVFSSVGRKFGRWHDVSWWQRRMRDTPPFES